MAAAFAPQDGKALCDRLLRAGLPAGPVLAVDEALAGAAHGGARDGRSVRWRAAALPRPGHADQAVAARRAAHARTPPKFGEHGAEVLAGLGYSEEEVAGLKAAGVVFDARR